MVNLLLSWLFVGNVYASSDIEEQRKYNFETDFNLPVKEFAIGGFTFHHHSIFSTFDIYFDTPEKDMQMKGYSFRLRRVEKTKAKFDYSLQLKSEMQSAGEARLEIESKDLGLQMLKQEVLTQIIDEFFSQPLSRKETTIKLEQWLFRKRESSLAPFQKLRDLKIDSGRLSPAVYGVSQRHRYNILTSIESQLAQENRLKKSKKNALRVPEYIKGNSLFIWLMEASYDTSVFYSLRDKGPREMKIIEIEIENKYRPRKIGTALLDVLEQNLVEKWKAKTGMASKYLQAVTYFGKD